MEDFAALIGPHNIHYTVNGRPTSISSASPRFEEAKAVIKDLLIVRKNGEEDKADELLSELRRLTDPGHALRLAVAASHSFGKVEVVGGNVLYDGTPIHNSVTERIVWSLQEGFDLGIYLAFLDKLMLNPSYRSVEQLFGFMEKHNMAITDEGDILAYKAINQDWTDKHTGTISNEPGQSPSMPRNRVDDNPNSGCSRGFHACALSYLTNGFYSNYDRDRVVIVSINPKDVVSVPHFEMEKIRVCAYTVLSEFDIAANGDLLTRRSVYSSTSRFDGSDGSEDNGSDGSNPEYDPDGDPDYADDDSKEALEDYCSKIVSVLDQVDFPALLSFRGDLAHYISDSGEPIDVGSWLYAVENKSAVISDIDGYLDDLEDIANREDDSFEIRNDLEGIVRACGFEALVGAQRLFDLRADLLDRYSSEIDHAVVVLGDFSSVPIQDNDNAGDAGILKDLVAEIKTIVGKIRAHAQSSGHDVTMTNIFRNRGLADLLEEIEPDVFTESDVPPVVDQPRPY